MDRTRVVTFIVSIIAEVFCCCFILTSVSISEEQTSEEVPKVEAPAIPKPDILELEMPAIPKEPKIPEIKGSDIFNKKEDGKEDLETDGKNKIANQVPNKNDKSFALSFPGDNKVQSIDFYFERTFDPIPFKFMSVESEGIKFELDGNFFQTYQKLKVTSEKNMWKTLLASFTGWEFLSRSYTLRLKGSTTGKFGAGGHIEIEGDDSIDTDPHLHTALYLKCTPHSIIEIAGGGWVEFLQLGEELMCPKNLSEEACRNYSRSNYGLHWHFNLKYENKCVATSLLIEYLPRLRFDEHKYRFNVSPEVEFKLQNIKIPFKDPFSFSIVLKGEIDYDSENEYSTIEPLIELSPWEVRWTQLVRHTF